MDDPVTCLVAMALLAATFGVPDGDYALLDLWVGESDLWEAARRSWGEGW